MFELGIDNACRICLEDGATFPIFEMGKDFHTFERIQGKLAQCLKIEDIKGYPRNICLKCKETLDTIYSFIKKFEQSCEILQSKVTTVKTEYLDTEYLDDVDYEDVFQYELSIDNELSIEPKVEKRDATEILQSLTHLTVKKVKVGNQDSAINVDRSDNIKKTRGRPKKSTKNIENEVIIKDRKNVPKKSKVKNVSITAMKKKSVNRTKKQPAKWSPKEVQSNTNNVEETLTRVADLTNVKIEKANTDDALKLCDLCGETFQSALRLKIHRKRKHLEREFKCLKCSKEYISQRDLNEHVQSHHENVRTATCDLCGKSYFKKRQLKCHLDQVHTKNKKKKKDFKCEFCAKIFHYKRGLIIHVRAEHTGERPAVCSICDNAFYDDLYLAEHMRIHTGDTPFKCPVCGRGYSQRGNMKSHMRNHKISELDPEIRSKLKPNYFKFMRP